jgi:2-desacetyl-2-hydroxyethyl bacteriochlorophyllide A dehydrogenase
MKALQIVKPREFRIVDIDKPRPQDDEVIVKLEYAAICNQNDYKILYGLYGDLIKYPCDPGVYGHEGVGIVVEAGARVKKLKEGDRVIMGLEGGPMLYREYVERKAESVVPISKDVPAEEVAPIELFGCAYHCLGIAGDLSDKRVALCGLGPAGLAIFHLMMLNPPKEIVGVEVSDTRAEAARELGLEKIVDPGIKEELDELIREGADLVIDATGVPQSILNSFEITRKEVILFGFTNQPFLVDQSRWFQKEMVIKNSKVQTIDDLRAVARLLEEGKIQTKSFISGIMSFEEYDKAVEKVYKKEAIKILLKW